MVDQHEMLGVTADASSDEVNKAFRRWAREHHPDRGGDLAQFQKMSAARDQLLQQKEKSGLIASQETATEPAASPPQETQSEIPGLDELEKIVSRIEGIVVPQTSSATKDWSLWSEASQLRSQLRDIAYRVFGHIDQRTSEAEQRSTVAFEKLQFSLRQEISQARQANPGSVPALEARLLQSFRDKKNAEERIINRYAEKFGHLRKRVADAGKKIQELIQIAEGKEAAPERHQHDETQARPSLWERITRKRR